MKKLLLILSFLIAFSSYSQTKIQFKNGLFSPKEIINICIYNSDKSRLPSIDFNQLCECMVPKIAINYSYIELKNKFKSTDADEGLEFFNKHMNVIETCFESSIISGDKINELKAYKASPEHREVMISFVKDEWYKAMTESEIKEFELMVNADNFFICYIEKLSKTTIMSKILNNKNLTNSEEKQIQSLIDNCLINNIKQ